jgi:hypothetical protein
MLAYLRHWAADAGGAPVLPLLSCTLSSHVSIPVSMLRYLICVSVVATCQVRGRTFSSSTSLEHPLLSPYIFYILLSSLLELL